MSGGSFDYAGRRMAEGDADLFMRYADVMLEQIDLAIAEAPSGRRRADLEQAKRRIMVAVAEVANARVRIAHSMQELAPLATALEWWRSHDVGVEDVFDAARAWRKSRTR